MLCSLNQQLQFLSEQLESADSMTGNGQKVRVSQRVHFDRDSVCLICLNSFVVQFDLVCLVWF